jgi:hypothetical protein
MIESCQICGGAGASPLFDLPHAPLVVAVPANTQLGGGDYAPLEIVSCAYCGHMYNRAFRPELAERMYGNTFLTNSPVHVSMLGSLDDIAEWIGIARYEKKNVIEIGAGSGHLARIIAKAAQHVSVYEPCLGLRPEALPESNISLFNEPFTGVHCNNAADLIVCRQVLEHLATPGDLIDQIAGALNLYGHAYLEVPSAEYIIEHCAFNDFHLAHVQYFAEAHLVHLAAQAGLIPIATNRLKDGHDFGILFQRVPPSAAVDGQSNVVPKIDTSSDFSAMVATRHKNAAQMLSAFGGTIGLYGATWHSQSLAAAMRGSIKFDIAFDDNQIFNCAVLHGGGYETPITAISQFDINSLDVIVIGAYLHDRVIAKKLRDAGFSGTVISTRPGPAELADFGVVFFPGQDQLA